MKPAPLVTAFAANRLISWLPLQPRSSNDREACLRFASARDLILGPRPAGRCLATGDGKRQTVGPSAASEDPGRTEPGPRFQQPAIGARERKCRVNRAE